MRRHLSALNILREASHTTSNEFKVQHNFTPQEASKLLPDIKIRMKQLIDAKQVITRLHNELEKYNLFGFTTDEMAEKAAQLDSLVDAMTKKISELEDLGISVKDLDYGIVDFPAVKYDEKVMLCWRYGEPEVSYWHRRNEGFNGRKPLRAELIQP